MEKAVQVGLVFPRSGQQVQVTLTSAHAERLGVRHGDAHTSTAPLIHQSRAQKAHEATKHT